MDRGREAVAMDPVGVAARSPGAAQSVGGFLPGITAYRLGGSDRPPPTAGFRALGADCG
jgi:hypothetical protein